MAAVVATLSLVETIRFQVSDEFDATLATQVQLRLGQEEAAGVDDGGGSADADVAVAGERPEGIFPPEPAALARAKQLSGVEGLAMLRDTVEDEEVALSRFEDPGAVPVTAPVRALSADGFDTLGVVVSGTHWGLWHEETAQRVAVIGRRTADDLGVGEVRPGDHIYVDGVQFTLLGVVESSEREPALRHGVVVPLPTSEMFPVNDDRDRMTVIVAPGAASSVAAVLPAALAPGAPDAWSAYATTQNDTLRRAVDDQLQYLALALGGVVLLLGIVSIGNATLTSVLQRIHEIGLRRALGARPRHIASHVLLDAALIGAIGGAVGALIGLTGTMGVAAYQGWQPIIDPRYPFGAIAVGLLAGALAGVYPAVVGSRLQPTDALRRE